ncbi:phage replisome organizer [Rahnella sp. ChDrAdgB13]|uniref:phage replisome organizer n=1 Tax=Rahnella sp. ChDrAdgB13 TaxID=1850581 RepID=UPI001AD85E57|nr:phage replisome organizer [Rahnella sp. ChDrAdgB13]
MANSWLRLWHDMPNDPKWRTIARVSGQSIALVQAVYLQLLVSAAQNPVTDVTGVTLHVTNVTKEDIASSLDVTEEQVESVTQAMQGRVLEGDLLSGWDKRQSQSVNYKNPGKPPKTGAERVRECRERKKQGQEKPHDVTEGNVTKRYGNGVTPQIRIDKKRKDKDLKDKNLLSHGEKNATGPDDDFLPSGDEPAPQKPNGVTRHEYPPEFEAAWQEYPRRPGSPDKHGAHKAWTARKREGVTAEAMLDGARRYAAFIVANGKSGTEFIQLAKTFFGPSRHFEDDWYVNPEGANHAKIANPTKQRGSAVQQILDARNAERQRQGLDPLDSDGQPVRGSLDLEERRHALDGLDSSDFEILG